MVTLFLGGVASPRPGDRISQARVDIVCIDVLRGSVTGDSVPDYFKNVLDSDPGCDNVRLAEMNRGVYCNSIGHGRAMVLVFAPILYLQVRMRSPPGASFCREKRRSNEFRSK